jgi:hypothetical protein
LTMRRPATKLILGSFLAEVDHEAGYARACEVFKE